MNGRLDAVMCPANAYRMHQALGRRFAGCAATSRSGSGMMRGSTGTGGWGAMTGSGCA
jgi:hypothetical protein